MILAAQELLTEKEGAFWELASATSLAGAMREIRQTRSRRQQNGQYTHRARFKDPDTAIKKSTAPLLTVEAQLDAAKKAILDNM